MYKKSFGKVNQISFNSEAEFYELLGYLAKNDNSTSIVWEPNDEQGAWTPEGRIHFFVKPPKNLRAKLRHTAGTGNIESRVNCNEFVEVIIRDHGFTIGNNQNDAAIRAMVPNKFIGDYNSGSQM